MTTLSSIPEVITDFFRVQNNYDTAALATIFTEDATIVDDGQTIHGLTAIIDWSDRNNQEYQPTVELLETREEQGEIICSAQTSGNFAGSPLLFFYHFSLRDQKIAALRIHL